MLEEIKDHQAVPEDNALVIERIGEPSNGGAHHRYRINFRDKRGFADIKFQEGPVKEVGVNGVTGPALIAVVLDQLRAFQAGSFPSPKNAEAIGHLEAALDCLHARTRDRIRRGVEGQTKE